MSTREFANPPPLTKIKKKKKKKKKIGGEKKDVIYIFSYSHNYTAIIPTVILCSSNIRKAKQFKSCYHVDCLQMVSFHKKLPLPPRSFSCAALHSAGEHPTKSLL
jgi:hypothetical protein